MRHLFGVEVPVPRGQREATLFLVDDGLHVGGLFAGVGDGGRGRLGEQPVDRRHAADGLIFQLVGGMVRVAQQHGALGPQPGDARDDGGVVELAAVAVAGERGFHDPLAQGAVLKRGERGLTGGVEQGGWRTCLRVVCSLGDGLRRGDTPVGHPGELGAVIDDD